MAVAMSNSAYSYNTIFDVVIWKIELIGKIKFAQYMNMEGPFTPSPVKLESSRPCV